MDFISTIRNGGETLNSCYIKDLKFQSATLDGGKLISKNENSDEEDEENVVEKRNCVDLTDEELFKACGGLTAHK